MTQGAGEVDCAGPRGPPALEPVHVSPTAGDGLEPRAGNASATGSPMLLCLPRENVNPRSRCCLLELSGEISQKVNLILNRFLNQFPGGRDQFAFVFSYLVILAGISHGSWYFSCSLTAQT